MPSTLRWQGGCRRSFTDLLPLAEKLHERRILQIQQDIDVFMLTCDSRPSAVPVAAKHTEAIAQRPPLYAQAATAMMMAKH
jgi:hypothetical protein